VDFKAEMEAEQELIKKADAKDIIVIEANSDPASVTLPLQDRKRNEAGTDAVNAIEANSDAETVTIPLQDRRERAGAETVTEIEASAKKEMAILAYLVFNRSKSLPEILDHPVAQTFLDLKWAQMNKVIFINIGLRVVVYFFYILLTMKIYFYDCPHNDPVVVPKAVNRFQMEQVEMVVECDWSLKTLIALLIVSFFLILFFAYEVVKGVQLRKFKIKFCPKMIIYLRKLIRMCCFLLAIGTLILPCFQPSLIDYLYPLAAVCIWVRLWVLKL
jgi:hypothetical protein